MKHPALTRAMAAVLAIMCAIMLVCGAVGIGDAQKEYKEDLDAYEKLSERVSTFKELSAKLDGEDSYKETKEKLDARQEEHDKESADFRTDLAERTATQGGYQQGANALLEAREATEAAYRQYADGVAQFQAAEAEFNAKKAEAQAGLAQLQTAYNSITVPTVTEDMFPMPTQEQFTVEGVFDEAAYNEAVNARNNAYSDAVAQADGAAKAKAEIQAKIDAINAQLAQGEALINENRAKLDAAGEAVMSAKHKVQGNLEQIWYDLGEMEDEEPELEEKRQALLEEAEQLEKDKEAAEQKKEDERVLASTRAALKNYDGIAALMAENDDIAACAEEYAAQFDRELHNDRIARIAIALCELIGGSVGFACLPSAYEKSKSRFLLLAPAALSFVLAAAGLGIALYFAFGMNYAVLPVLIFAPIYLLSAAPRNKYPAASE